jgi:hypothetical protein
MSRDIAKRDRPPVLELEPSSRIGPAVLEVIERSFEQGNEQPSLTKAAILIAELVSQSADPREHRLEERSVRLRDEPGQTAGRARPEPNHAFLGIVRTPEQPFAAADISVTMRV